MLERVRHGLTLPRSIMPPCITSSQLTSHCQTTGTLLVCGNPFELRMTKSLPPEPSRPIPAAKMYIGDMLYGLIAQMAMDWLKKYKCLWQNFPANMMTALLTGMAQGAMAIIQKTMNLLKREGHGSGESRMKQQHLKDHLKYPAVNNNEGYTVGAIDSLMEDNCSGHFGKPLSPSFREVEMDETGFEKEGISELCIMSPSIFLDWRSHWGHSSEEDVDLEVTMSHGELSRKWLEDYTNSQISLEIGECFGKSLLSSSNNHEELEKSERDPWQSLESTLVTQVRETSQEASYEDLMMHEKHSLENAPDCLGEDKHLEMNKEDGDEDEDTLDSETSAVIQGFKSSVVLSLFYSPSEDEGDDLEDGWSEDDEMEDSGHSRMSLGGSDSGKKNSELKDDTLHEDENPCGLFFMNNDPFHPLCFSKTLQPQSAPTAAPPKPKNKQEITVSFYQSKSDTKAEEPFSPPKKLWPKRPPRVSHRSPFHKCCQPDSKKKDDLVSTEASPVSQEQNQVIKKVRFSTTVVVHPLVVWDYASRSARHGPWEEMARDRSRFHRRIAEVGAILEPCLKVDHRAKVWRKIHDIPGSL